MNQRISKEKYIQKFCTKWVWFSSLTGDLVFFAIVDTLFLTIVKGLTPSQITLFSTIPSALAILLQPTILKMIHKIGNTKSIRVGAFSLLLASLLITFGNQFWVIVLGRLFHEIAFVFKNMENICLKNNLIYAGRENDYIPVRNQSTVAYAVITAVIAFGAGSLFNSNSYLPMILNCILCFGCFILSLTMKDVTKYDVIPEEQIQISSGKNSMIVYVSILSYAFFYTAVSIGQSNSKLLLQYELSDYFEAAKATTYFSMMIAMSRIARVVSNCLFDRLYHKLKDKINMALTAGLIVAFGLILFGNFITGNGMLGMMIMTCGFFIILAVRDPFKIYIQDLILKVTEPEEQQAIFANLELARKIGQTLLGFVVSAVLLQVSLIWIIVRNVCAFSHDAKDDNAPIRIGQKKQKNRRGWS